MNLIAAACLLFSAINAACYFYDHARGKNRVFGSFMSAFVSGAAFVSFWYQFQVDQLAKALGMTP